ncbi:MAG: SEL1-like repeat protein [Nitrospirae bacterium]|nr:SEL1-like repeat protein [Nitrospirota bacterium]
MYLSVLVIVDNAVAASVKDSKSNNASKETFAKAEALFYGKGVKKDYKSAFKLYQTSAASGNPDAQAMVALSYLTGLGTHINYKLASEFAKKAADNNSLLGKFALAMIIGMDKQIVVLDMDKLKTLILPIAPKILSEAEKGGILFQTFIGQIYLLGIGVPKSEENFLKWSMKAAEQGEVIAQTNIGSYYQGKAKFVDSKMRKPLPPGHDIGPVEYIQIVPESEYTEALKWYKGASDQGYPQAQFLIANVYNLINSYNLIAHMGSEGISAPQPPRKFQAEYKWLLNEAAEQGFVGAMLSLGLCYEYGLDCPQNTSDAVEWYHKCTEQGLNSTNVFVVSCQQRLDAQPKK